MSSELRWSAGDVMPRKVPSVIDRLGVTWWRTNGRWSITAIPGKRTESWDYLVNNRGPLRSGLR